jgi:hypothetical protein
MADDADTLSIMLYGQAPTEDMQRQAMAAALRRNQLGQDYGGLLQAMGNRNPALGALGQSQSQAAQQRQGQLFKAPEEGVNLQEGLMKLAQAKRRNELLADGESPLNQVRAGMWQQLGGQPLPPGFNTGDLSDKEFELQKDALVAKESAATRREMGRLRYGPGGAEDYTQEAIDTFALQGLHSGHLPQFGPGATGAALRRRVLNRMAELAGGAQPGQASPGQTPPRQTPLVSGEPPAPPVRAVPDLAGAQADYEANKHNLTEATAQAASQKVLEEKATGDMERLKSEMVGIPNYQMQFANKTVRELAEKGGNVQVSRFAAQLMATANGVSQAIAGSRTTTVDQRGEAKELLSGDLSVGQMMGRLEVLLRDVEISGQASRQRVESARQSIRGGPEPKKEAPAKATPAGPKHDPRYLYDASVNGRIRILKGPDGKPAPGAKPEPNPDMPTVADNG